MTTALTPAIASERAPAELVGGLNENRNDELESLYNRITNLQREDYAVPLNRLEAVADSGSVSLNSGDYSWRSTAYALDQLSGRLARGLSTFGRDLRDRGYHDLYAETVNGLLESDEYAEKRFQVRTIQPNGERVARAVVSTAYKPIDDSLCVPPMLELVGEASGSWRSLGGQITDRKTHIRFLNREPSIRGIGPNNRDWFIGFEYTNSEVGSGKCCFNLFFYDAFCENGCVFGKKAICDVDFLHIGAQIKTDFGLVLDERVLEVEQASIQRSIVEATQKVLSQDFSKVVRDHVERSGSRKLEGDDKAAIIRQIGKSVGLTNAEQDNALAHWDSREDTALGVHSAITRLAQDAPTFEKRVELESAGGKVLELDDRKWKSLLALSV